MGNLGMQCHVGTCLYTPAPPAPPPPPGPARPPLPAVSHPEMATIIIAGALLLAIFGATAALIARDRANIKAMRLCTTPSEDLASEDEEMRTLTRCGAGPARATCSTISARPAQIMRMDACRSCRGASHPLLSGHLPEDAEVGRAVCYAFHVESYAVLNMFPLRARHILTDVAGVAAPFQGRLRPSTLGSGTPAPSLMCILGPSGAGALIVCAVIGTLRARSEASFGRGTLAEMGDAQCRCVARALRLIRGFVQVRAVC